MKQAKLERKVAKLQQRIARIDKQAVDTKTAFDALLKLVGANSNAGRAATIKYEYVKQLMNAKRAEYEAKLAQLIK